MTLSKNLMLNACLFFFFAITLNSCEKDEDDSTATGNVSFEITDAPIDNTNIKGAFITVTAVKVDGEVISNFNGKISLDLLAYQNGNTSALGLAELEAGTYNNVSLVLDYETDSNGNTPGCYVLTTDNTRHSLKSSANAASEISINNSPFTVSENSNTTLVMDFDVRKAVRKQDAPTADDEYDFVTEAELRSAIRVTNKEASAKISGTVSDNLSMSGDRIVVYAYTKGSFDLNTEVEGQGSSNITFKNAVSSCVVKNDGSYNLSFLPEGEYELHYISYQEEGTNGELKANGMLNVNTLLSLDILGIQLDAAADIEVNVVVTGLTPF